MCPVPVGGPTTNNNTTTTTAERQAAPPSDTQTYFMYFSYPDLSAPPIPIRSVSLFPTTPDLPLPPPPPHRTLIPTHPEPNSHPHPHPHHHPTAASSWLPKHTYDEVCSRTPANINAPPTNNRQTDKTRQDKTRRTKRQDRQSRFLASLRALTFAPLPETRQKKKGRRETRNDKLSGQRPDQDPPPPSSSSSRSSSKMVENHGPPAQNMLYRRDRG